LDKLIKDLYIRKMEGFKGGGGRGSGIGRRIDIYWSILIIIIMVIFLMFQKRVDYYFIIILLIIIVIIILLNYNFK